MILRLDADQEHARELDSVKVEIAGIVGCLAAFRDDDLNVADREHGGLAQIDLQVLLHGPAIAESAICQVAHFDRRIDGRSKPIGQPAAYPAGEPRAYSPAM